MKVQQLTVPHKSIGVPADNGFDTVAKDIKVIALVKGGEQYVFLYSEDKRAETLRLLGRYASNPELSFTWYDAAVLSQKIRQESLQQTRERQRSESSGTAATRHNVSLPIDELF
jgi:hypothetical protein